MTMPAVDTAVVSRIEKELAVAGLKHCDNLPDPEGKPALKGLAKLVSAENVRAFLSANATGKVRMLIDGQFDLDVVDTRKLLERPFGAYADGVVHWTPRRG